MTSDVPSGSAGAPGVRAGVLLLADSQEWETTALDALRRSRDFVVARRCLDVADLMAVAVTGEAGLAVVAGDAGGFDADCVTHLSGHGVAVVAVVPTGLAGAWTAPRGTADVVEGDLTNLAAALGRARSAAVRPALGPVSSEDGSASRGMPPGATADSGNADSATADSATAGSPARSSGVSGDASGSTGRVVCVWGPVGSPGRTTLALALAGELAARGRPTTLVDVDVQGGTVAQHLGILSEVSGLLAGSRAVAAGTATSERLRDLCVAVGKHLRVLTGLPSADRWSEVGAGAVEQILELARRRGDVVVDAGPWLDAATLGGWGGPPAREHLATEAVAAADLVVLVGAADPVGLARLVRGAEALRDVRPEGPDLVVVNRTRPSLGWSPEEVTDLVTRTVAEATVVTLPEDRAGLDRALVEGSLLTESGPGPLRATVRDLVEDVLLGRLGGQAGTAADTGQVVTAAPATASLPAGLGARWRARRGGS